MSHRKLINSSKDCVEQSLFGYSQLTSTVDLDPLRRIVYARINKDQQNVAIISGGGSGHEPFPAGYVGRGMLTASVSGSIFSSPPSSHILQAIRTVATEAKGILLVVPNYAGDVLNFGLAAERAKSEGIKVENLVVGEDIAQEIYGISSKTGKRGTCGLIFVLKIVGYLSMNGESLESMMIIANNIVASMGSLSLCVYPCSKPGEEVLFHLDKDEMVLGIGVHGEDGVGHLKPLSASEAIELLLLHITQHVAIEEGDEVIAMINNLGSLTWLELWLLAGEVKKQLSKQKIQVVRLYADTFFTSLNMAGVQICLLKLRRDLDKDLILKAMDGTTSALSWSKFVIPEESLALFTHENSLKTVAPNFKSSSQSTINISFDKSSLLKECVLQVCDDLLENESYLNYLDSGCGDGDCGDTFGALAREISSKVKNDEFDFLHPDQLFSQLSTAIEETAGGTTGGIYALFFRGVGDEIKKYQNFDELEVYKNIWKFGVETIKKYSVARIGDRTMLDSLEVACNAFEELTARGNVRGIDAFKNSVTASEAGCQKTSSMKARVGRASYMNSLDFNKVDAGAFAVTVWLRAILKVLDKSTALTK